jgi:hypothetical protein
MIVIMPPTSVANGHEGSRARPAYYATPQRDPFVCFPTVVKTEAAPIVIPIRKTFNATLQTHPSRPITSMGFHCLIVEDLQDWKGLKR